jgi:phage terminase small subunit
MLRKLSVKQEAYKNNRIMGLGISESYKAAYNCKTMSDNAISKEATKLEQDPRIAPEVKVKRQEATERALVTVEDVVRGLLVEAERNGEGSTQSARVAAWKALSDFTGGFDANKVKTELTGANGGDIKTVTRVERVIVDTTNSNS